MLRLSDQRGEALARVLAVARLAGEALGEDDDHAFERRARAGELDQLDRDVVGQARRAARVETQFDRARHLVDVLPAGAGGANEVLDDLALVDEEIAGFHRPLSIQRVMAGLVPAIHAAPPSGTVETRTRSEGMDDRGKPGHDGKQISAPRRLAPKGARRRRYRHSLTSTNRPAIAAAAAIAGETRWVRPL